MILLDASGLLAAWDNDEQHHTAALRALKGSQPPRLLSPLVLAEVDYLVRKKLGQHAQMALLAELTLGAYRLPPFNAADVAEAADVMSRFSDLGISLADASIVVIARRFRAHEVLTLDERHFRVLRGPHDRPFRVLPADA